MLSHTKVNGFDFYITEARDTLPADFDPFFYLVEVLPANENGYIKVRAECANIPCSGCPFVIECEDGANLTKALANYVKGKFPELFI